MFRRFSALFVAVIFMASACSGADVAEQVLEGQEGVGDVEIDENDGSVSVETDDGSAIIGGGDLPDDMPFDVPGGGEVLSVFSSSDGTQVSLQYPAGEFDSLEAHFTTVIEDGDFEIVSTAGRPGEAKSWNLSRGEGGAALSINAGQDVVLVGLAYADLE